MNVVFFGSSKFAIPILEVLQKNFNLKLVLTTENPKGNLALQGETLGSYPVVEYCVKNKIPYLPIQQFNNLTIKQLQEIKSTIAVLADFGLIIPKKILNAFPMGILNIHPSLLPKYRGPTPVQTAILNREKETGVTIIKLDEEVDHGPILFQQKVDILSHDTSESLYAKLFKLGASSIVHAVELYVKGKIKPLEQNHKQATFTKRLTRQDGYVEISNLAPPAKPLATHGKSQISKLKIDRIIRAYYPWPGVWTKWKMENGKWKIIKLLPNQKIQVEGKKPMSYKDFLNGYPQTKQQLQKLLEELV